MPVPVPVGTHCFSAKVHAMEAAASRYPRGRCLYKLLHDISFIRDNDGVMAGWGEFRCGAVREGRE